MTIVRFTPGETTPGVHYNRRTFQLSVRGGYHEIGRFLSEIGSLPRIITPIGLDLYPQTSRTGSNVLEASFMIETYVLPDAQTPAAGGTGA